MNSSRPVAADRRALANQSIVATGSPISYGRVPITSLPWPRRRLGRSPKGSPTSRRRGTSGKVWRSAAGTALALGRRRAVPVGRGRRCELQAAILDLLQRGVAAERARLSDEGRRKKQAMAEHREEERLDVARDDVVASLHERPRARGALER